MISLGTKAKCKRVISIGTSHLALCSTMFFFFNKMFNNKDSLIFRNQTSFILFYSLLLLLLFSLDGLTLITFIEGTSAQKAKFFFLNIDCRL